MHSHESEKGEDQHQNALVQGTLDLRVGVIPSFEYCAGAATAIATNKETSSNTLENMTID